MSGADRRAARAGRQSRLPAGQVADPDAGPEAITADTA